jgi:hypothetical protein
MWVCQPITLAVCGRCDLFTPCRTSRSRELAGFLTKSTEDDLDGINRVEKYADDTLVRVLIMRTERDTYPSG